MFRFTGWPALHIEMFWHKDKLTVAYIVNVFDDLAPVNLPE